MLKPIDRRPKKTLRLAKPRSAMRAPIDCGARGAHPKSDHLPNNIAIEFGPLADLWERETRNVTSPKAIVSHPALHSIIALGEGVVPLILRRMEHHPWFWFDALKTLTRATMDPITPSMRGDMQQMTDAWLHWGTDRGII